MISNRTIKNLAYLTIIMIGCGWILFIGSSLLQPVAFSCLIAIFLIPIQKFFVRYVKIDWLSIVLSFLTVLIPVFGIFTLFSLQLVTMVEDLPSILNQVEKGLTKIIVTFDRINPIGSISFRDLIKDNLGSLSEGPLKTIRSGILSSSELLLSIALSFLYTFFLMYYRKSIKNFIVYQFARYKRHEIHKTLLEIKHTVQNYITGLGIVILILSTLNTIGLSIIGIDYPIFWGTLAGVLAVIPYVGTFLGGLLPFLYSLSTTDTTWQPIAIAIYYIIIQQIEGNFITPKVIGNKVNINPLVAIFSLIFFGAFWGVGGIILALPLISVTRIILEQFDETKALSLLMSADIYSNADKFKELLPSSQKEHFLMPEDKGYRDTSK